MNISNGNARGVEVSQGIVKCVSAGMLRGHIQVKAKRLSYRGLGQPFTFAREEMSCHA